MYNRLMCNRGFTLVELSLVIIIIGLIVASVLSGKSLIDSAKMRSDIQKLSAYKLIAEAFKLEYSYYPGDLPNGNVYWPTFSCGTIGALGDGNNDISMYEGPCAWSHLVLAGMYPSIIHDDNDDDREVGEYPESSEPNISLEPQSGAVVFHFLGSKESSLFYEKGNYLNIGASSPDGPRSFGGGYSPARALTFDNKIDDGIYNKGKVFIVEENWGLPADCITAGQLNLSESLRPCFIASKL